MRRNVVFALLIVLLVGAGLLWLVPGGSSSLFLDGLDWSSNASTTNSTDTSSSSGNESLEMFGLTGPASCRTVDPPTKSPWLAVARTDAQKYHIDPIVFEWKIWQESGYNPNAVSKAGAIGIAQFMPETAAGMGIDPRDPEQALDASARLDAGHIKQYVSKALQLAKHYGGWSARYGYALALAAYNAGPGSLNSAWNRAFASAWPSSPWAWLAQMALETRHYIPNILNCSTA
jgi:hypothetical protein